MAYPGQFVRLVVIGSNYDDIFNFSLSIVPSALGELGMPAVNDATLASVAAVVDNWFDGVAASPDGPAFTGAQKLTSIKLNRIGPDGHYVDPVTKEHIYPTPIAGGTIAQAPAQIATVATLLTAIPRGRASKGRIYLPPTQYITQLGTDGRLTAAQALNSARAVRRLVNELNGVYTLIGKVGVASNAGSGKFEHVTGIKVGRVPDTMRSRRNKLDEDYQEIALT